jgi:hypothetical protein
MNKQLLLASAALTVALSAAHAELVAITFEDLAAGTALTSQYAPLGVQFSTSPFLDSGGVLRSSVEVLEYEVGSFRTNAVGLSTNAITLNFDSDVSNFSVVMRDTDRGTLLGRIRAYDSQGRLMGHMTDMTSHFNTSWFYENTLRVDVAGIRTVEITSDADGVVIDNITYTRVPTPGALALLPLGLLALGKRKR